MKTLFVVRLWFQLSMNSLLCACGFTSVEYEQFVVCLWFQLSMNSQQYQERKTKLEENLAHVCIQFRKLHLIYDKVLEISSQTEDPTPQVGV